MGANQNMDEAKLKQLEETKTIIRSLVIPHQNGCKVGHLKNDFHELEGREIPYRQFGYGILDDFLRSIQDVVRFGFNKNGELVLFPVVDENTEHIHTMVQEQRKTGKPKRSVKPVRRPFMNTPLPNAGYRSIPHRANHVIDHNHGFVNRNNFNAYNQRQPYQGVPLYTVPLVPLNRPQLMALNSWNGYASQPSAVSQANIRRKPELPFKVKCNILMMLRSIWPKYLPLSDFETHYWKSYASSLGFRDYGFTSVEECLNSMSGDCRVAVVRNMKVVVANEKDRKVQPPSMHAPQLRVGSNVTTSGHTVTTCAVAVARTTTTAPGTVSLQRAVTTTTTAASAAAITTSHSSTAQLVITCTSVTTGSTCTVAVTTTTCSISSPITHYQFPITPPSSASEQDEPSGQQPSRTLSAKPIQAQPQAERLAATGVSGCDSTKRAAANSDSMTIKANNDCGEDAVDLNSFNEYVNRAVFKIFTEIDDDVGIQQDPELSHENSHPKTTLTQPTTSHRSSTREQESMQDLSRLETNSDRASTNGRRDNDTENFPPLVIGIFRRIISKFPNGIPASDFYDEYEKEAGYEMDPASWGFHSPIEVFYALPSVFSITPPDISNEAFFPGAESDHILYDAANLPADVQRALLSSESLTRGESLRRPYDGKPKPVDEKIQLRILKILQAGTDGISIPDFGLIYELNYKEALDYSKWNYVTLHDFFVDIGKEIPVHVVNCNGEPKVFLHETLFKEWLHTCITKQNHSAVRMFIDFPEDSVLPGDVVHPVSIPDSFLVKENSKDVKWIPVLISSAMNPDWIWIHLQGSNYSDSLEALMDYLTFYNEIGAERYAVPPQFLVKDLVCCARFATDGEWHRVKITRLHGNNSQATVSFIDYGGVSVVDCKGLRLLKREFAVLQAQAVRVCLKGIRSPDKRNPRRWSMKARQAILQFSNKDYWLACSFYRRMAINKYEVHLCDTNEPDADIFIHKLLVDNGLAEYGTVPVIETRPTNTSVPNNKEGVKATKDSSTNSSSTSANTITTSVAKSRAERLKELCRSISNLDRNPNGSISPVSSGSGRSLKPWSFSYSQNCNTNEKQPSRADVALREKRRYCTAVMYNGQANMQLLGSIDIRKSNETITRRTHLLAVGSDLYVFRRDIERLLSDHRSWQPISSFGIDEEKLIITDSHVNLLAKLGLEVYVEEAVELYPLRGLLKLCETLQYSIVRQGFRGFFEKYEEKHKKNANETQLEILAAMKNLKIH